jgi:3-hydroxyisobutyrate dehydrogenase
MARNLARAGFDVVAWNRTPAKARALADVGIEVAASGAEAVAGAEVLVTMLADGPTVEAVLAGPDGALAGFAAAGTWLQMSTVGVPGSDRLARLAEEHGVVYVDAPVLGSSGPAASGELVILGSGPEEARDRCAPIFEALGSRTMWVGEAGAGSRLKVVINSWLMANNAAIAETIAMAERIGVDPRAFLEATDDGAVSAVYARSSGTAMATGSFSLEFPLVLAAKDAALGLEAIAADGPPLRLMAASHADYAECVERGYGDRDWTEVIRAARAKD